MDGEGRRKEVGTVGGERDRSRSSRDGGWASLVTPSWFMR